MPISHSEFSTYLECSKKWLYKYRLKIKRPKNIHMLFGIMAHDAIYTRKIPSEDLYPEFKEAFGIVSWNDYFSMLFSELDRMFADYTLINSELRLTLADVTAVIDAIYRHNVTGRTLIVDYKFTSSPKTYEDLIINAQLPWYACVYALSTSPRRKLSDIDICYVSIPKTQVSPPKVLKNGSLSKDKSQSTTYALYLEELEKRGLSREGYEDILSSLLLFNPYQKIVSDVDEQMVWRIFETIRRVQGLMRQGVVLEHFSDGCKTCEYMPECKCGVIVRGGT